MFLAVFTVFFIEFCKKVKNFFIFLLNIFEIFITLSLIGCFLRVCTYIYASLYVKTERFNPAVDVLFCLYLAFLARIPLIRATIETISGAKTTKRVAMLTEAAKATGNIPNPALDGASRLVPREII